MVNKAGKTRLEKPAKKSGFIYKERKFEDVKRRAEKPQGRYDSIFKPGFDTYRPKQGENIIRILPPRWEEEGHDHYGYTVYVHSYVGADKSTYLCPARMKKKHCPICEAAEASRKAGEEEEARQLSVREQSIFWIINRDAEDKELHPLLYSVSGSMDRDILSQTITSRSGKALMIDHPDDGYDLIIKRTGQGLKTRYVCTFDRESSPVSEKQSERDEVLEFIKENSIPTLLKFYGEDYLAKIIEGTTSQKDGDLEEEEEDIDDDEQEKKPRKSSRKSRDDEDEEEERPSKKAKAPFDEEEDEEEDEDEETETRSRSKSTKRRPAADDDEEEEEDDQDESDDGENEDDEEDEKPKKRQAQKDDEEEDDGDEDEDEEPAPPRRVKLKKRARA